MQVVVKKHVLDQMIRTLAEERSYHSRKNNQIAGDDRPVLPDAQMAMQLSTEQIPVGNPDFLPVNKKQAAAAAAQMTAQVDPDKLQKYFAGLKKLIRKTATVEKYKGMSETDLFEALRPMVLAEAEDEMVNGVIKVFKSNPKQWDYVKKQFDNLVANFEDDPFRLKDKYRGWEQRDFETLIAAMKNTAWSAPQQPRQPRQPKEAEKSVESPTVKPGNKPSRLSVAAKKSTANKEKEQKATAEKDKNPLAKGLSAADKADPKTQDALSGAFKASLKVVDQTRNIMINSPDSEGEEASAARAAREAAEDAEDAEDREGRPFDRADRERGKERHVKLDDVIKVDIRRIIDVFEKASMPIPKSFAESGIQISFASNLKKLSDNEEETPVIIINFTKPGSNLEFKETDYGKGSFEITKVNSDGSKTNAIYDIIDPFPFDEKEYKRRIVALFPGVVASLIKEKEYNEYLIQRRAEDVEIAALQRNADRAARAARSATVQKKLSIEDAKERATEILAVLEDFKIEKNNAAIEKVFKTLKINKTPANFMSMAIDEKAALETEITEALIANRSSFYNISHMDYVRDILDSDRFESEYGRDTSRTSMYSTDPTSSSEQELLEIFYQECFKPLMIRALTTISNNIDPDAPDYIELKALFAPPRPIADDIFKTDSYEEFVEGVDIEKWKELVNQISKDAVINQENIFKKIIPDFYPLYVGIKGRAGTSNYDERLDAIGMKDIGRQREPFEHIRSTIALMKAVTSSAMIEILDPEETDILEKVIINPDKLKSKLSDIFNSAKDNYEFALKVLSKSYKKYFNRAGIRSFNDFGKINADQFIQILEADGSIEEIINSRRQNLLNNSDVRDHVNAVVEAFIGAIGKYFSSLTETSSMAKRGPIYDFMQSYAADAANRNPEIDLNDVDNIAQLVMDYTSIVDGQVEKAKQTEKKNKK